jgi:glycosyltransferase involved in cell wall biosynthesis
VRILIFHGYLLDGTGSNVYNARLAAALARLGHEVHLLCQDGAPAELPFVDAVGSWDEGALTVRTLREPVRVTVYRPPIGRVLPVYVQDAYDGFDARTFLDCTAEEIDAYVSRNVAAVAEVASLVAPDVGLANHLVMGPLVLARGLGAPYAVKIHGSALEYTVKRDPARFLPYAREGLARASGVLVGSRHTAESLWAALGDAELPTRTRLGPPGVDVVQFAPREREAARRGLRELVARLADAPAVGGADAFARDPGAAARALARLGEGPLVAYTGKLIVSKGVDLLLAAWPLVLQRVPDAQLAIVGFGAYRETLERMVAALGRGDLGEPAQIAEAGRALEGGPAGRLELLATFLGRAGASYADAARGVPGSVVFTGRLDHDDLAELLPACCAQVVPSTFPESFGMVAAEAAACAALPVSAEHSGLAEVSRTLAAAVPAAARGWLSFPLQDGAVERLADNLVGWLHAPAALREETRAALAGAVREHYSWEGVARAVLSAATGDLGPLPQP